MTTQTKAAEPHLRPQEPSRRARRLHPVRPGKTGPDSHPKTNHIPGCNPDATPC
jgi:hypothetical protein